MKKRCAILLNSGRYPRQVTELIDQAAFVIATDGAFRRNCHIDLVIGDMDSIDTGDIGTTPMLRIQDQHSTDGEKAINHAIKAGYTCIDLIGIQGDRLDHGLFHIQLMQQYAAAFSECIAYTETERCWIATGEQRIEGTIGQRISLINLSGAPLNVSTQGLHWQVDTLIRHSLSNRFSQRQVTIEPHTTTPELLIITELPGNNT